MVGARGIAQEHRRAAGIAVGEPEPQPLDVERLAGAHVGHGEDDMAHAERPRPLVHRAWLVDAAARARHVERQGRARRLLAVAPHPQADIDAAIVDRVERAVGVGRDAAVARQLGARARRVPLAFATPHTTSRNSEPPESSRRQILGAVRADHHVGCRSRSRRRARTWRPGPSSSPNRRRACAGRRDRARRRRRCRCR